MLLTFPTKDDMDNMLANGREWLNEWFEEVLEWKLGMCVKPKRTIWIKCFGVPLNVWNPRNFINIGSIWGEIISLDIAASKLTTFECGKVKVETSSMEAINREIILQLSGNRYQIGRAHV